MASEWFRAVRVKTFIGIPRNDPGPSEGTYGLPGLDRVLDEAGVLSQLKPLLDLHTIPEPLHVSLRDQGYSNRFDTPEILVIDAMAVQTDGGLNEIPRATCMVPIGRAISDHDDKRPSVLAGDSDADSASILQVIEKYLTRHVPAKIFIIPKTVSAAGEGDRADNIDWADEPMVLFDGIVTGPSHQASAESNQGAAVLHLLHFLGGLTFSSSLSGQVSAGGTLPVTYQIGVFPNATTGATTSFTIFGAIAATLAGGEALSTDFWGYQLPSRTRPDADPTRPPVTVPASTGLKGMLWQLADTPLFNWQVVGTSDFGGSFCGDKPPNSLKNNGALGALGRIEPLWPEWGNLNVGPGGGVNAGPVVAGALWSSMKSAIEDAAVVDSNAVDRNDIITRMDNNFYSVGYRYGVPISFYLSGGNQPVNAATTEQGRAFASDITGASFETLNSSSFWELLTGQYAGRYQIGVMPMADRAVIIPLAPVLEGAWQFIRGSEIFTWSDDIQLPVPVRGVMLASSRMSGTGVLVAGFKPFEAGYDSCQQGVFVTKEMPPWLLSTRSAPATTSGDTVQFGPKNVVGAPWAMGPASAAILGGAAASLKIGNPGPEEKSTAARLAKSMWQQERLRYRSIYVTGRFRVDIAPGSTVIADLPMDKHTRQALGPNGPLGSIADQTVQGLVLRVTHSIDEEGESMSTSFQIGFPRLESETAPGQPLHANIHPYWRTACFGAPWCDSTWIRERLGAAASLAELDLF